MPRLTVPTIDALLERRGAEMRRVSAALMPSRRRKAASGTENDNARLRGSLNDAPRPRAVFGRPFKSLGSLFDLFLAWENGALFTLKSPERVMQCTDTECKRLTNEVGAVWGFLGHLAASRLAVAPGVNLT